MSTTPAATIRQIVTIDGKQFELTLSINDFKLKPIEGPPVPDPDPPVEPPVVTPPPQQPPAEQGTVKPGGWGANTDPSTWKVTQMKKPNDEWKIVDDNGKNVATNFTTQEAAQAFVYWSKDGNTPPPTTEPPVTIPPTTGGEGGDQGKDQFGISKLFADKPGGVVVTQGTVEHKTRNYASGAPSEPTVELTIEMPSGHQQDMECTAIVTMPGMQHNDTIDWKVRGPGHSDGSGKNWYCIDQETDGGHKITLKTEKPHPKYFDNSNLTTNYFVVPNISKAKFGWKGVVVNKSPTDVYIACWINMTPENESGWRKVWDCHDTGQVKNGQITPPTGGNCQVRIDGIDGKVKFENYSVREIVYNEADALKLSTIRDSTTPPVQPPVTPPPVTPPVEPPVTPPPTTGGGGVVGTGRDKFGTKLMLSDGSNVRYDYRENFQGGGKSKRWDFICGKTFLNCELTAYVQDNDKVQDEASGKMRGGKHSDGLHPKTYDMGVELRTGKTRYRTEDEHPVYEAGADGDTGVANNGKFIGYKFICNNAPDNKSVNLQIWQDAGDNEGEQVSNQWKKLADWKVTDPLWVVVATDHQETLRIDDDAKGSPNLKIKNISLAEIQG